MGDDSFISYPSAESESKLCPFRPITLFKASFKDGSFSTILEEADFIETQFGDCYKEKCALWHSETKQCGLKNKYK